jgi:hypothetical protein
MNIYSEIFFSCSVVFLRSYKSHTTNNRHLISKSYNTQWEKVEIPSRFSGYLMQGIYSDYLKSNGTKDEAEDVKSEEILSLEIDSLIREQGQVRKTNVSTY